MLSVQFAVKFKGLHIFLECTYEFFMVLIINIIDLNDSSFQSIRNGP